MIPRFPFAQSAESNVNRSVTFFLNQPYFTIEDTAYYSVFAFSEYGELTGKRIMRLMLFSEGKGMILQKRIEVIDGLGTSFLTFPTSMSPGDYLFVCYIETSKGDPTFFFEGLIAVSEQNIVMPQHIEPVRYSQEKSLNLSTDAPVYSVRDKIKINVANNPQNQHSKQILSTSVYNQEVFETQGDQPLLWALSPRAFSNAVDVGSERLYYFKGTVIDKKTKNALNEVVKITFYLNHSDFTYEIVTKSDGTFLFPLFKNFGDEKIFYKISQNEKYLSEYVIYSDNIGSYSNSFPFLDNKHLPNTEKYNNFQIKVGHINESFDYYLNAVPKKNSRPMVKVDHHVSLEKYEPFLSMKDVVINIVPMVSYRGSQGVRGLRVFLQKGAVYGKSNPLFIVDGVMCDDASYVLNLNPSDIKQVGVIRTEKLLSRFGDLGKNGILVIDTYRGDRGLEQELNTLDVVGVDHGYADIHLKTSHERRPYFRTFLYWNSRLTVPEDGADFFFNMGDDIGNFVIVVAGLDGNGKVIIAQLNIEVTP